MMLQKNANVILSGDIALRAQAVIAPGDPAVGAARAAPGQLPVRIVRPGDPHLPGPPQHDIVHPRLERRGIDGIRPPLAQSHPAWFLQGLRAAIDSDVETTAAANHQHRPACPRVGDKQLLADQTEEDSLSRFGLYEKPEAGPSSS